MMLSGKVKFYNDDRGYGFIIPDDGQPDVFVHIRDIENQQIPAMGDAVTFDITTDEERPNKTKAVNVRLV